MAYFAANQITGSTTAAALTGQLPIRQPVPISERIGDLLVVKSTIIFVNGTNPALNDVIEMLILPAYHVPEDFWLVSDDFDSGTTAQIKAGLMSGSPGDTTRALATVGTELIASGSTTLQAASAVRHPISAAQAVLFGRIAPSASDRSIGIGIQAAATNIAADRRIDLVLAYRASRYGA